MKHILITTIAAVVLLGCGQSDHQHSHDDDHSHAEGDHHHAEGDSDGHDKDSGGKSGAELKGGEPVIEATQPEPPTAKAPDISIHDAAKAGDIETVKQHLAAGTDVDAKDKYGRTPLHLAPGSGHKEIAELLIAKGADVNAKNKYGVTPLHFAAGYGRKEIVELLIAKGADVNAKVVSGPKQGLTPLDAANETNQHKTVDLLRKHGGKTGEELK